MNERTQDHQWLRQFAMQGDQHAFAALVRRHLDLVYATALRRLEDPGMAEEVAQTVFATLARKAWQFAPDDSLPAWLHRAAVLEAKARLRGELRRRHRENTAAELGTTMNTSDQQAALRVLVPMLDEALLSLREKERTALLLRFYEGQSLREVGASLGIREDAARKRVTGALEAVTRFFQRRGFRTATLAASAAVLEQTAASAPGLLAASIAQTAAQAAPALASLAAWLARLSSLTKAQVTVACAFVAVTPVTWQWHRTRTALNDARALQAQVEIVRTERTDLMIEIERMLSESARLNTRLAQASDSQARQAETRRALALLKTRIQSLLTSQDYRWPADLPFVRVPKSTVRSFDLTVPFAPPGTVQVTARELLGLTAHERQTIEAALTRYFDEVSQRVQSVVYETNRPLQGNLPVGAAASRVFAVPALGQDIIQASERMVAEIAANLGEERWNLIKPGTDLQGSHSLRRILSLDAAQNSQQLVLWITQKENTPRKVGYGWSSANGGGFGAEGTDLAAFAPANTSPKSFLQDTLLPAALIERGTRWLTQEAEARLSTHSNP